MAELFSSRILHDPGVQGGSRKEPGDERALTGSLVEDRFGEKEVK